MRSVRHVARAALYVQPLRTLCDLSGPPAQWRCFASHFASNPSPQLRCFTSDAPAVPLPVITKIELRELITQAKTDTSVAKEFVLLDVRRPEELQATGTVDELARNVPVEEFEAALSLPDAAFSKRYGFPKPTKSQHLVVYCRSGVRSERAGLLAKAAGFTRVTNFKGSALAWFDNSVQ